MVKIFNLHDEVLKFAAKKKHTFKGTNVDGNDYGIADDQNYGHVKVVNSVNSGSSDVVSGDAIYNHVINSVTDSINTHEDVTATTTILGHVKVDSTIKNSTNPVQNKKIKEALDNKIDKDGTKVLSTYDFNDEYKDKIDDLVSINVLQEVSDDTDINNIDDVLEEGSFVFDKTPTGANDKKVISYGNRTNIYYTKGIIENKKVNNRIIQKVYSTKNVNNEYYLDGSIYQRIINTNTNPVSYGQWHCVYINTVNPNFIYSAESLGTGVDSIQVFENTAGFIITWEQDNHTDYSYEIQEDLYKYVTICDFTPNLPIQGEYIFGNLIGKIDVKITSQNMQVRSTLAKNNHVYDVKASYFVPREC